MLNLRDLIFSQSQSQSQPLSQLEPLLQPLPLSYQSDIVEAIDDSEDPAYDDDEYVDDFPDESEKQKQITSKKRKSTKYSGNVPLLREDAANFSKIYAGSPELQFIKRSRRSGERVGKNKEVRDKLELS